MKFGTRSRECGTPFWSAGTCPRFESCDMSQHSKTGFTLIELLVVVSIIAVLLALLTPALDKAIYQAELAACAAKLDAIATATDAYAFENTRMYPYRPTLAEPAYGRWWRPLELANQTGAGGDNRPYLKRAYGSLNKLLLDPLCGRINLDHNFPPVDTNSNYPLWFGMSYPTPLGSGKAMRRLGDTLEWTDNSRGGSGRRSFSVIASDTDVHYQITGTWQVITGHPDTDNMLYLYKSEASSPTPTNVTQVSQGFVLSWWGNIGPTHLRGTVDTNYAFTDGSVERFNKVEWDDERMARVPWDAKGGSWSSTSDVGVWHHLPRR